MFFFTRFCLTISFLFVTSSFASYLHSSQKYIKNPTRTLVAFDSDTKWDCFYRSTVPVPGLNPSIWRHDQYRNLLMAGLNFNCKGCLCYTFDHRYPISNLGETVPDSKIIELMSSINNCQAVSYRTNILKGSNEDSDLYGAVSKFGCDAKTMKFFYNNNFAGARVIEKYILSETRMEQIAEYYNRYLKSSQNLHKPTESAGTIGEYFKKLQQLADGITNNVTALLAAVV